MLLHQYWREIEGMLIEERFRVGGMLRADPDTLFAVEPLQPGAYDFPLAVRFMRSDSEPLLDRYTRAMFVTHPNLLPCVSVGRCSIAGAEFVYAVLERAETTLADIEREHALRLDEASELGQQLISALSCLHQRKLIYCNLDPTTVARVGKTWKLSEFSQIRIAGAEYANETRRLLAVSAGIAPEAWAGIVSPAWDAWSLSWLLCCAVEERGQSPREQASARAPFHPKKRLPLARLVDECLKASISERAGLARIGAILESAAPPAPKPALPSVEPAPELKPPPVAATRQASNRRTWSAPFRPRTVVVALAVIAAIVGAVILLPGRGKSSAAVKTVSRPALSQHSAAKPAPPPDVNPAPVAADSPEGLLQRWAAALRSGDVAGQMACYSRTVYLFYGEGPISVSDVRRRREQDLARLGKPLHLEIANVTMRTRSPSSVVVTFDETWQFQGPETRSGGMKVQLSMRKTDEGWRISAETKLQTYRGTGENPQA
ncbi:MAG TPA: nuclear transport factor 2 family protein [Bryobacteraceae bacterium]|nr:nuclear transport factor 2 family protein [Bryobacteraceae bacterium]